MKRMMVISDPHCGHVCGLTPPEWQGHHDPWIEKIQSAMWDFYRNAVSEIRRTSPTGKIDILLSAADGVEGPGHFNKGREVFVPDMNDQAEMYRGVLTLPMADDIAAVTGTPSHVGREATNYERIALDAVGGTLDIRMSKMIHGVHVDMKHMTSSSSIPHGRGTPLLRQKMWESLWAEEEGRGAAQLMLRGHVHYHLAVTGLTNGKRWWVMSLPSLQGPSDFGARACDGIVNIGVTWFDLDDGRVKAWDTVNMTMRFRKPQTDIS